MGAIDEALQLQLTRTAPRRDVDAVAYAESESIGILGMGDDDDDGAVQSAWPDGFDTAARLHGQASPVPAAAPLPAQAGLELPAAARQLRVTRARSAAAGSGVPQPAAVVAPAAACVVQAPRRAAAAIRRPARTPPAPPVCGSFGGNAKWPPALVAVLKVALAEHKCDIDRRNKCGYRTGIIIRRILEDGWYPELRSRVKENSKVLGKKVRRMMRNGEL